MASETHTTDWTQEQLATAQRLTQNANSAVRGPQAEFARALLYEARAVLDMVEDQNLDAVLELRAQILNELGFFYQRSGDIDQALECHTNSVEVCEQLLDRGVAFRPNTTATLINLAGVLMQKGDISQSLEKISKATSLISSYLEEHPDEVESNHLGFGAFHTRALIELADKQLDAANASAEQAAVCAEKTYEENLMTTLQAANGFQQLAVQFFNEEQLDYAIFWAKKSEEVARIAFDIEKEPAIPVFVQTQLFLILFHENKGNFDAAEDALYNAIDVLGNHPQLLDRGRAFYLQCRKQSDKRLEEGGLPRTEVEEGIKEIESRIEAFGGAERLAQVLAELTGEEQQV